jgi:2'-5' RNA ligase
MGRLKSIVVSASEIDVRAAADVDVLKLSTEGHPSDPSMVTYLVTWPGGDRWEYDVPGYPARRAEMAYKKHRSKAKLAAALKRARVAERPKKQANESVPQAKVFADEIYWVVQSIHRDPDDLIEGDLGERIGSYAEYELRDVPLADLMLDEWDVDEHAVDAMLSDYEDELRAGDYPPIVLSHDMSFIDGIHRANALARLGSATVNAYVGVGAPQEREAAVSYPALFERMRRTAQTEERKLFVSVPVAPELAQMWPAERGGDDKSPPHFTVLYVGEVTPEEEEKAVVATNLVADETPPFEIVLNEGVDWFENHKNESIAHKTVNVEAQAHMEALHEKLLAKLQEALGREIEVKFPEFKTHSTLQYCDGREYDGPVPEGSFVADSVTISGRHLDRPYEFSLAGGELARAASARDFEHHLPGGLADDRMPEDFDADALEEGAKVEMEHVEDEDLATEIAMDHLEESKPEQDYYDKLDVCETITLEDLERCEKQAVSRADVSRFYNHQATGEPPLAIPVTGVIDHRCPHCKEVIHEKFGSRYDAEANHFTCAKCDGPFHYKTKEERLADAVAMERMFPSMARRAAPWSDHTRDHPDWTEKDWKDAGDRLLDRCIELGWIEPRHVALKKKAAVATGLLGLGLDEVMRRVMTPAGYAKWRRSEDELAQRKAAGGAHQESCGGPQDCGGEFECAACSRDVGWCMGADDDHPDFCDDCWVRAEGIMTEEQLGEEDECPICKVFPSHARKHGPWSGRRGKRAKTTPEGINAAMGELSAQLGFQCDVSEAEPHDTVDEPGAEHANVTIRGVQTCDDLQRLTDGLYKVFGGDQQSSAGPYSIYSPTAFRPGGASVDYFDDSSPSDEWTAYVAECVDKTGDFSHEPSAEIANTQFSMTLDTADYEWEFNARRKTAQAVGDEFEVVDPTHRAIRGLSKGQTLKLHRIHPATGDVGYHDSAGQLAYTTWKLLIHAINSGALTAKSPQGWGSAGGPTPGGQSGPTQGDWAIYERHDGKFRTQRSSARPARSQGRFGSTPAT